MYNIPYHNEDLSKFSFLVTGAAGFIGSNLVEYLLTYKAGKVIGLDNLETGRIENLKEFLNNPAFTFLEGDITNLADCKEACKNVDIVFHQAALGSVPRSIDNPIATNHANIDGFLNILTAAKDGNVKRVIYAASSSTYGDSKILPKKEEIIGKPLSPYAVTKYVNELYADVFGKVYSMQLIGLRYFNVFGPKQNPSGAYAAVIPRFIQNTLEGKPSVIEGDGSQTRDFTFIENVVQANILAGLVDNSEAINQVYNVAVGENISIKDLYSTIQETAGANFSAIFKERRTGDVQDSLADITKAKQLLKYNPTVRLKEGIGKTYSWFQEINKHIQD